MWWGSSSKSKKGVRIMEEKKIKKTFYKTKYNKKLLGGNLVIRMISGNQFVLQNKRGNLAGQPSAANPIRPDQPWADRLGKERR